MARETIIREGGRPVMLRRDVVEKIDELAQDVELMAPQGLRKGQPDRVGTILAAISLVLSDPRLRERLRDLVAPQVEELRARQAEKIARRERSGGKRGRPPNREAALVKAHARERSKGRTGRTPGDRTLPDLYDGVAPDASSRKRRRSSE